MLTHVSIICHVLDPISASCLAVFFMFAAQPSLREVEIQHETSLCRHPFSCSLRKDVEHVEGLLLQLCFYDRSSYLNFLLARVCTVSITSVSRLIQVVQENLRLKVHICSRMLFWAADQVKAAIAACVTSRNSSLQTTKGCVQWSKYGCGPASDIVLWLGVIYLQPIREHKFVILDAAVHSNENLGADIAPAGPTFLPFRVSIGSHHSWLT